MMQSSSQESKASFADAAANGKPLLLPQHLADLRRSGLSDDQIAACGFYSVADPSGVARLLGWRSPARRLGPCLAIPYPGPDGQPTGYVRLKPDRPRAAKQDGKPIKYESPVGQGNRLYVPPHTRQALAHDPSPPLLITEGEKKAARADQDRFPCLGLVGVYGWQKKRVKDAGGNPEGPRELIEDLGAIAWQGRTVSIVFDSDAAEKKEVRWAEWHLAQALTAAGAEVKVVRLPQGPVGADGRPAKVGLDDLLVGHGPDAFRELLAGAVAPAEPEPRVRFTPEGLVYRSGPFDIGVRKKRTRWDVIVRRGEEVVGVGLLNLADVKARRELLRSLRGVEPGEAEELGAALMRLAAEAERDWQGYLRWVADRENASLEKQLAEAAEQLKAAAEQLKAVEEIRIRELEPTARGVLADPALLYRVGQAVAGRGVVGEGANVRVLFLAVLSQVTDAPISVVVKGDSAGGKSFLVSRVLSLLPDEGRIDLTSMSDRALIYDERSYSHKTIVIFEVHGQGSEFCDYIIRTLISEGQIRHQTVESTPHGLVGREIVKEGPTNFITTTTFPELHAENETRIWTLLVDDSEETTKGVLKVQAEVASGVFRPAGGDELRQAIEWLKAAGAKEAVVPFAALLAEAMPGRPLRLRRDFPRLLQAHFTPSSPRVGATRGGFFGVLSVSSACLLDVIF
jgi:hypothetical protein